MVIISPVWVSNLWSTRWIRWAFLRFFVHWFIVLSAWVSAVYTKYVSTPIHLVEFPQKNQFSNKPGFPLSKLIILVWYPYVSLFPWFIVLSSWVSAIYAKYLSTPIHLAEFPQKISSQTNPELIIFAWYSYVSLFPDLLWNIGLSVSSLRKMRFNAYTPRRISTKKSVPKQTRIPIVRVDNFR